MCDTGRVKQTMNAIFMEDGDIATTDMPALMDFDMSDNEPTPVDASNIHASFSRTIHTGTGVSSRTKESFPFPPVAHMGHGSVVPVRHRRCRYPLNAIIHTGNLSNCKSMHGVARCKALDGKTVMQALGMHYLVGGSYKRYTASDLHYDCDKSRLLVSAPHDANANYTFSTMPITPVDSHVNGLQHLEDQEWFNEDAAFAIKQVADLDPFITGDTWKMEIEFNGTKEYYSMKPDRTPHSPAHVNQTFVLSSKDKPFVTHKSLSALDHCPYKDECLRAIEDEYAQFDKRCFWKFCKLPPGAQCHKMMLLGKIKYTPGGNRDKVKFRCVIMGNDFVKGRDCDYNTFAPNAHVTTARCMIYDAVSHGKCLKLCDVKQAYTFSQADRRVFVNCPPGRKKTYDHDGTPHVYEITGNCYGSPGASKRWNIAIHNTLIELQFTQSTVDPCLYNKGNLSTLVYTDDFLSSFPDTQSGHQQYNELVDMLTSKFKLGDDGHQDCTDFIGMHLEFNHDRTAVVITQPLKISELLQDSNLEKCRPSFTPGIPNTLICTRDCPSHDDHAQKELMKSKPYRRRVGQLLWLARTSRPDIAYQVNALARVAHNPGKVHWDASTHIIRYLSHTKDMGLIFRRPTTPPSGPTVCSDANWAPDYGDGYDNYRSTSGFCVRGNEDGSNLLSWGSSQQRTVALSSAESEWNAAVESAKESAYINDLFRELSIHCQLPITLKCDNQSTIKQSIRSVDQKHSGHIGMKAHYLRQQCHNGNIKLEYVPTKQQTCDIFTKVLPTPQHEALRLSLGVMDKRHL